jgi:hypothetical protein
MAVQLGTAPSRSLMIPNRASSLAGTLAFPNAVGLMASWAAAFDSGPVRLFALASRQRTFADVSLLIE